MLIFIATGNAIADETIATPNKLIVFKIDHNTYYTQDIGSTEVNTVQMDTEPFIKDSRTFVPVRFLGNALGVDNSNITWNNTAKKATLQGKNKLELTIGNKTMQKDTQKITMDVAPLIADPGRTMLPARYVAEGLGFKVDWDAQNQLVIAYPEGQPKPDIEAVLKKMSQEIKTKEEILKNAGDDKGYLSDSKIADMYAWGKMNGFDTTVTPWKTQGADYTIQIPAYHMSNVVINVPIKDPSRATKDALLVEKVRNSFGDDMADWVNKFFKVSLIDTDRFSQIPSEKEFGDYAFSYSNNLISKEFKCTILRLEFRKI